MKTSVSVILLIIVSIFARAQQNFSSDAISFLPYEASDFLILDSTSYPNVVDWNIEIFSLTYDSSWNKNYTSLKRIQISDSYFVKIDPNYRRFDYYISIIGSDINSDTIVNDGPLPICPECPPDGNACSIICVGPDYAWRALIYQPINIYGNTGPISVNLFAANNPSTGQPFYQYFSPSQFAQLPYSSISPLYYGLTGFNLSQPAYKVYQMFGVGSDSIKDVSGNVLNGTVYCVQKYLGPWHDDDDIYVTNIAVDYEMLCNSGISQIMSIINNSSQVTISPNLACAGTAWEAGGGGGNSTMALNFVSIIDSCGPYLQAWLDAIALEKPQDEINSLGQAYLNCINAGGGANNPGFAWPDNVKFITFKPYFGGNTYVLEEAELFSQEGEFTSPVINFQKGLFTIGLQFNDDSFYSIFVELKETGSFTYTQSNFLSVNIYPVPIIDNRFTMNLHATAKLEFEYKLLDLNGNEYYRKTFVLEKDHHRDHLIDVEVGIPNGQLVNKFIFNDGSEINILTVK